MTEPKLPKPSPLNTSNEVIEQLLKDRALEVEKCIDADIVSYRGPIFYQTDDMIRDAVEALAPKRDRIAMLIETDGGYIEVAERIARVFRQHYKFAEFIITNSAMSAGTVLVMSGDVIRMDYYSILGPIDPQVQRAGAQGRWVPALGYLEKFESLIKKSKRGQLSSAELTFLVEKFDPAELFRFEHERDLSIALLKEWLVKYKFKNWKVTETRKLKVSRKMKEKRAGEIAAALSKPKIWHTHSRGISMQVLRDKLKLKIDDLCESPHVDAAVKTYDRLLADYMHRRDYGVALHTREVFRGF